MEDWLLGGLIILLLSPLLAVVALLVRIDSPGPILFKQRRHAANNREFFIYKFRTMRWQPEVQSGAEALIQTARDDNRITRLGSFLRKTSIDELPQLFNVLRGEMSLVGPRPHAVNMRTEERLGHEIVDTYAHRHRVKPGITGWSQVNGSRGATNTVEQLRRRVELDIYYVENWSLYLDLKILAMTFVTVLWGRNAFCPPASPPIGRRPCGARSPARTGRMIRDTTCGDRGTPRDYTARPSEAPCAMEINPIKSEITALRARFDALRGYL